MTQATRCRRCGAAFPAELEARDYEEICPRCLASIALEEDSDPSAPTLVDASPPAPRDPPPLKRGATFRGMEVLDLLGQGGMGVVYKARQIELDRTVALKVLSPRLASDEEFARRFMREAKALASLDHPHIVRVHDFGRDVGLYFLVMEFVDGVSLRDVLAQKKLAPERALRIVPQICEALEFAHSRGVIHRDIKPENILLDRSGSAKIADFGLAKIIKDEKGSVSITQTNEVMGTVEYMAPEQRDGLKEVDHRADIYSLGVVLYELLTGELPVGRFDLPSRRMRIDVRVDDIVLKALEKNPELRYQRASHMGTDVSQVIAAVPAEGSECPIIDLATGRRAGTAPGRRLSVRTIACPLSVRAWERDEIGFKIQGDYQLELRQATPVLQSQVETAAMEVFVPRGIEIDVVAAEGTVVAESVAGHFSAKLHDGNLVVSRHDGSLRVQSEKGFVEVDGLKTESFEIQSRLGRVVIRTLSLWRGRGHVETESGDVAITPTEDASFRYDFQSGSGKIDGPPAGHVGGGGAVLTVRTTRGSISLAPAQPRVSPEGILQFLRRLPPKQLEHLGVYAIVNVALFIFCLTVAGTPAVAICVAVFWGMAIALELWKSYVRQTRTESFEVANVLSKAMKAITTPGAPARASEPPPPPPQPPKPRASFLGVLAVLAGIGAAGTAAAAAIAVLVETGSMTVELAPGDLRDARLTAFVTGLVAAGLGILGSILGVTVRAHVSEAKGALKGKAAGTVAVFLGGLALAVAALVVHPHLRGIQDNTCAARETAREFVNALRQANFEAAHGLLSDSLRRKISAADLGPRVRKAQGEKPDLLDQFNPESMKMDVDRTGSVCRAHYYVKWRGWSAVNLELEFQDRWRVRRLGDVLNVAER